MTQRKAGNKGRRNAGKNSKGNQQAERALTTGYVKTVYKTLEYSVLSKLPPESTLHQFFGVVHSVSASFRTDVQH